jgi:hypothetical protein
VTTVTDLSKVIDGVRTLVIWERDFTAGQLSEPELAFFAQDNAGNVWLVGEYPEEYEDGEFDKAPAWISGQEGARAGIAMPAEPRQGAPDYAQGFAPPPADFTDRARVYKMDQKTCTPVECYENVLVTEEFNPDEPGAFQLKYYASGVGNVRVGWRVRKRRRKRRWNWWTSIASAGRPAKSALTPPVNARLHFLRRFSGDSQSRGYRLAGEARFGGRGAGCVRCAARSKSPQEGVVNDHGTESCFGRRRNDTRTRCRVR